MQMMELVELTPLRDLLIGSPSDSGLSVEQRKRLSIAVELVANPAIVLMDEPTSGKSWAPEVPILALLFRTSCPHMSPEQADS